MTINTTSRYAQSEILWVKTRKHGNKQTAYLNTIVSMRQPYAAAVAKEDDTYPLLAAHVYRNSRSWWVLADANPQVFYPLDLRAGQSIRVPQ